MKFTMEQYKESAQAIREDGQPVSSKQVFYVVTHAPHTFALAEGRIMLMM